MKKKWKNLLKLYRNPTIEQSQQKLKSYKKAYMSIIRLYSYITEMSNLDFILIVITITNIDTEIFYEIIEAKSGLIVHTVAYTLN